MATERSAAEILGRFQEEQDYILRYVDLLRSRLEVTENDVWRVRGVLQSWKLTSPRIRLEDERNPPIRAADELERDFGTLEESVPAIKKAIVEQQALLQRLFGDAKSPELTENQSEWVAFLDEHYADALLTLGHDAILEKWLGQHERECADPEKPLDPDSLRESIRYATGLRSIRKIRALEYALKEMEEIRLLLRVATPHAEIHILRQGFILLMTAFDAAIFDLIRAKLRTDFFSLVGCFGKQERISLQDIGNAGSFEAVRDGIIEDQMKKRYVKDLLIILDALGIKCTDEPAGDSFGHLIELVLRRNVHVHNRGIVDERYLERDENARKARYNLFNLDFGQPAIIDDAYWRSANRLCRNCTERVFSWAHG